MQGKVKWFSKEKGYGYIIGEDGVDFYFNVRGIQGADLPHSHDLVSFEPSLGSKGPMASSILITKKYSSDGDQRVTCTHCGKKMVPRIISYRGQPSKSVCPYCAGTYKDFGGCFIATAVYGDYFAPEVTILRRFRDEILSPFSLGRKLIHYYYKASPPIARTLSSQPLMAHLIKGALTALVFVIKLFLRRQGK